MFDPDDIDPDDISTYVIDVTISLTISEEGGGESPPLKIRHLSLDLYETHLTSHMY